MKIGVQFRFSVAILAVVIFGLANCSSPAGGGGGGGGGSGGGGGGGTGGGGGGSPTVINEAAIYITAPVKSVIPSTTATGTGNFTVGTVSWSPAHNSFLGNEIYTVSVTLTANKGYTFTGLNSAAINGQSVEVSDNTGSAVTLSHTFPATNDKIVTDIAIKTQPTKLTYKQNDKLDLTGLVVTLTHDDKTTEDVTAANFADKNITTNPAVGSSLVYPTHNGQPVKITYGNLTKYTNNLTVAPPVNAVQPVISAQPQGGTFFKTGTLSVTASVTDGGTLSYQWHKNAYNNTTKGTAISGATGSSYALSDMGTYYYYVIVTNTITNNGDGGTKTAQTTSSVAAVTIELVQALWTQSVSTGDSSSKFNAVAVDSSGNVYAAGYQEGNSIYTYSPGIFAQGTASFKDYQSTPYNVVLVKYDSSGTAQWAKTVSTATDDKYGDDKYGYAIFNAVAVDSSGNVYAAGYQRWGNIIYTYGPGVSAQSAGCVVVKYNSSGTAQWAKTSGAEFSAAEFNAVAVDYSGNVYAAGCLGNSNNVRLVKYDSNGTVQWTNTVTEGTGGTGVRGGRFSAVAVDSLGNVYAAGYQYSNYEYTYGEGVSARGTATGNTSNVVLVKYNSSGTAQWAKTISAGNIGSSFNAVAVDSSGNVYAAGYQMGNSIYSYGPYSSIYAQGSAGNRDSNNYYSNVVLVKYNSSGTAQWAKTVSTGNNSSVFRAVAVDLSGNVYAAGSQNDESGGDIYTYGTGVSARGGRGVVVKYNSSGTAQWAKLGSENNAVTVDSSDNVYAAGYGGKNSSDINVRLEKYKQ